MQIGIDEGLPLSEVEDEKKKHVTAQAAVVQCLSTACERVLTPKAKI